MAISFYGVLVINGANDIIAVAFNLSINQLTWFTRIAVFVVPPLVFLATRRFCLGLQRRDRELLLHGRESGQILRLPHGEFIEIHTPIADADKAVILAKEDIPVLEAPPATDENGVATPGLRGKRRRARWSQRFFGDNVATPTAAEIAAAEHHAHELHDHEVDELTEAGKDIPASITD
jgi:ubiquinol-cytochrome c reductase cytochrome b subunit